MTEINSKLACDMGEEDGMEVGDEGEVKGVLETLART